MSEFLLKEETYKIPGLCMEVHRVLGYGFKEIVYKYAICHETQIQGLSFEREKKFNIIYKGALLKHFYYADFVYFDKIIVEIKAAEAAINDEAVSQTLNYLKASGCRVGLIVNFGCKSLVYKRLIF